MATITRGNVIDYVVSITGNEDTAFRTHLEGCFNDMLYAFWDLHDWNFKTKAGSIAIVNGTEEYNLRTATTDLRSSHDIEVMWDSTNKNQIKKEDLKNIRKADPGATSSGPGSVYAPYTHDKIIVYPIPNGSATFKFLYTSLPTLATSDSNDLESACGLPREYHHIFKKMVLSEGLLQYDDSRRTQILQELEQVLIPKAIEIDMKNLESTARFKFWEEEIGESGSNLSYDQWLRRELGAA